MSKRSWTKIAVAVAVAAALGVAYWRGAFDAFDDPARLKATLLGMGPSGFLVYLVVYALLQPVGVPGIMLMVVASLVWPPPVALLLSFVANGISTVIGFSFARYVARDWVARRIPARLRKYDERLATHGFLTVLVLRSLFWMNPTLHALFGVSHVGFGTHLAASMLAYVVPVVALTYLGDAAFQVLKDQPVERWFEAGGAVVILVGLALLIRRRRKAVTARPA